MKNAFSASIYTLAVFAAICILVFFLNGLSLASFGFFAPKVEAVRRQTFEQSQAYNEGMLRDLQNIRSDYLAATTDAQRAALRATALHRFAAYKTDRLPMDLQAFYAQIQNGQ